MDVDVYSTPAAAKGANDGVFVVAAAWPSDSINLLQLNNGPKHYTPRSFQKAFSQSATLTTWTASNDLEKGDSSVDC